MLLELLIPPTDEKKLRLGKGPKRHIKTIPQDKIVQMQLRILSCAVSKGYVIPNLYDFLSSVKHKRRYFEKCLCFLSIQ